MNKHITIKSLFCLAVLLSLGLIPSQAIMPGPGDGKLIKSALSGNLSRAISGELGKGVKSLHSEISTNISKMARAQRTNIAALEIFRLFAKRTANNIYFSCQETNNRLV